MIHNVSQMRAQGQWVTAASVPVGNRTESLRVRPGTSPPLCSRFGGGTGFVALSVARPRRIVGGRAL